MRLIESIALLLDNVAQWQTAALLSGFNLNHLR